MENLIEERDGSLLQTHVENPSDYLIAVACGAVAGLTDIFLARAR